MVTFYADWCPYCKTFDSEYANAAKDVRLKDKNIRFGAVDVMANRDLTKQFGIKRSPTVKVFGHDKSSPEDYLGQRKQKDVIDYVDNYTTKHNFIYDREAEEARIAAEEARIAEEQARIKAEQEAEAKARAEAAAKAKNSYRVDPYADDYHEPLYNDYDQPHHPEDHHAHPEPEAPKLPYGPATYEYNMPLLLKEIEKKHKARVEPLKADHLLVLKDLGDTYTKDVTAVKG